MDVFQHNYGVKNQTILSVEASEIRKVSRLLG